MRFECLKCKVEIGISPFTSYCLDCGKKAISKARSENKEEYNFLKKELTGDEE